MSSSIPGWYPDPSVPGLARYWNGQAWTGDTTPISSPSNPYASNATQSVPYGKARGKELLRASWEALKQDKQLLWLPVLSSIFASLAVLIVGGLSFVVGSGLLFLNANDFQGSTQTHSVTSQVVSGVFTFLLLYVSTTVAVYFQVALAAGAMERLDGGSPTVSSCLRAANRKLVPILLWSLVSATVGWIIRFIFERSGFIGQILIALFGVAWSVITFFVVPVLLVEAASPFRAISRSKDLMVKRWGKVARSELRFGTLLLLPTLGALFVLLGGAALAVYGFATGVTTLGVLGLVLALLGFFALMGVSIVASAAGVYLRTVLYRYASGLPVPGIDPELLQGAIVPKG